MAPLLRLLLPLSAAILLLFASPSAARPFRPCDTVLITYTFTSSADDDVGLPFPSHRRSFAILRILRPDPSAAAFSLPIRPRFRPSDASASASTVGVTSSLRERAKDVLVVVVGLLFGVGCGALTAATMYLAWSLFTNRYEICGYDGYGYDDDEEEIESPKKMGYASIPPAPATPASPVKEGYEGRDEKQSHSDDGNACVQEIVIND